VSTIDIHIDTYVDVSIPCVVLRPLNINTRAILVMKPRDDGFRRPMFDIKVDLDRISLNMNQNQVRHDRTAPIDRYARVSS
jgi:hypothetical protein